MKTLTDCFGREVRVTDERLAHILERPELGGMDSEIEFVLRQPRFVRLSRTDHGVLTNRPKAGEDIWPTK